MNTEKLIELRDVSIGYDGKAILSGVSLSINRGELIGVSGPNGAGKSTLIKTILGLIPPVSGTVDYKCGLVFGYLPQYYPYDQIFPVSVYEIVCMGRYSRVNAGRRLNGHDHDVIAEIMRDTGTENLRDRTFRSLSGGEKQRVLLAKALSGKPDVLVLDEPTTSLDNKGESEITGIIRSTNKVEKLSVIMINHKPVLAASEHDVLVMVDKHRNYFTADKVGLFYQKSGVE